MRIPKLRFKEFSGEWEEIKLKQILEFKNGINASKEQYGKGIKFINVLDILNNDFITYDNIIGKVDIDEKLLDKYSVNYGDILFQRSSETREEVGMTNVYLDKKIATFGGFVIRGKKIGNYVPTFINKVLKTNLARNEITSKAGGSTRYNVGQAILNEVQIIIPNMQEQQKIADFLSSVDKKISITEEKLNLFKDYKKGMMQKIFKQEIRFKDENGNDYPDWVETTLEKLPIYISDGNYGELYPKQEELLKQGVPFIRVNNLKNYKITFKEMKYISKELHQILLSGHLIESDILVCTRGEIGITAYVDYRFNGANINAQICLLRIKDKNIITPYFLLHSLNSYNIQKQFKELQTGTALKQLPKKNLTKLIFKLPCLEEQEKIAEFLSSIDNKIENLSNELENLKEFKKGLLQKMFI